MNPLSRFRELTKKPVSAFFLRLALIGGAYFLIEAFGSLLLMPDNLSGWSFGFCWSMLLGSICLLLPRKGARIFFGITYMAMALWTIAQVGYDQVFEKMMWFSTILLAGEGATFLGDVILAFPFLWWIGSLLLIGLGVLILHRFPRTFPSAKRRLPYLATAAAMVASLVCLPELVFLHDNTVWGANTEYAQSSSYRAAYNTMYDARKVYDVCGIYQMTFRDIWKHEIYPHTDAYLRARADQSAQVDHYFNQRKPQENNAMTGKFGGKNVVMVLMESMDDWLITPEDTPTLHNLMQNGINFTEFYTPGYGSARTLNSEFCMNTGIYLPTNGHFVFDYITNNYDQTIASQLTDHGYSAQVFHYNNPDFYSRGILEPALGYEDYNCYADYEEEEDRLMDDSLLFDIPQLKQLFFREGPAFNMIITRSAHLSYVYHETLSDYALKQYPEYKGLYGSEEEDCARVKAKLVDDMFARLLEELEAAGQLENTVIIGVTDHYTYGYKDEAELFAHSQVEDTLLLEKTPCFIWSSDCTPMEVSKTLQTADLLPTVLNLLGIDSPYSYLGQDAFDPSYIGYAIFPDGSWICDGVAYDANEDGDPVLLQNEKQQPLTAEDIAQMGVIAADFIHISNLLLTSNYYEFYKS